MNKYSNLYTDYTASIQQEALPALQTGYGTTMAFLEAIPADMADYRYTAGKWSVKQVLIHMTDAERVFSNFALRIARGEKQPLPGFDKNTFAENSYSDERRWEQIVRDFKAARLSSIELFRGFTTDALQQTGTTNGEQVTLAFLGKLIAGHCQHHIEVLKKHYL